MRNCSSKSSNAFSWNLSAHQLYLQSSGLHFSWAQLLVVCLGRSLWQYLRHAEQWCSEKNWKTLSASDARVRHGCLRVAASASHFIVTGVIYFWILKMFQYICFQILLWIHRCKRAYRHEATSRWGQGKSTCREATSTLWGVLLEGCSLKLASKNQSQHPAVCPCCGLWWCQSGTHHLKEALLGLELFPLHLWSSLVPRIISRASSI